MEVTFGRSDAAGRVVLVVEPRDVEPVAAVAGIVAWQRTLAKVGTWVWRTAGGEELRVAVTGGAPERDDLTVIVLAGPFPIDCRLDHVLEPGAAEELDAFALYDWLAGEITENWPFLRARTNNTLWSRTMSATPFALVSMHDRNRIFAYGLDIDLPSGREVVTFRREADGRSMFSVHESVETARRRFSAVTPLELVWEPGCRCCVCVSGHETCGEDGACSRRLGR